MDPGASAAAAAAHSSSASCTAVAMPADVPSAPPAKLSATQLKKLKKASQPYTPPVDANGERLYARKRAAPPQKQRRDLIAEQNPNRTNLRRWGHTCNTVPPHGALGERVVAFAGWGADSFPQGRTIDHRLNSIAVFHPDAGLLWQSPASVSGVLPVAREQHTAVLIPAAASTGAAASSSAPFSSLDCQSPHLLVFGGRSNPSHALHDIALLNLSTYEWVSLPPATMGAGVTVEQIKRFRHTAVWAQHKMIVYGGCKYETHDASAGGPCTVHTVYNDVLVLDTSVSPMHWERVTPAGCQEAKPSSTTTGVDAAVDTTDTTDSDLAVMPHKHTHAAAYCSASQSWYIFGGYSDANFHRNPTDNALYRLSSSSPSEWSWQCLSGDLTGVPPPPIASSTLHVLSKRFLLLLGGVSSEDMYSLSSLWVVDLHRQTWSRPTLHAGSNTRFHPVIERQLALQENRCRHRTEEDATTTEEKTDDTTLVESANGGAPVRIVEHSFICKHSAVFVDSRLAAAGDIDDTMDLLLCGGGGNVFHFNPFFNPTLRFVVRIPRESAASQPNTDGGDIEITVDSVTAQ